MLRVAVIMLFSLIMAFGMEYTLHNDWNAVWQWVVKSPFYIVLTILFLSGVYYCLTYLIHFVPATIVLSLLSYVWSAVNYLKYTMRNEYVIGDDVLLVLQGQMSFKKEDVTLSAHLLIYLGVVIAMWMMAIVYAICSRRKLPKMPCKKKLLHAFLGSVIALLVGGVVYFGESLEDYLLDASQLEKKYGLLLSFVPNNCLPHIITNDDYEPYLCEQDEKKEEQQNKDYKGVKPNIIIIMSESLYDTDHFDNIVPDQDPMNVMHELQKEYGGGSCAVNIFGGGTANTEFEFLTGISTKYYCGNLMYNNSIHFGQMSMVNYMKQMGYHTVSIHPYKKTFFNREYVYSCFGFDESYFVENMNHTKDRLDINVSDYSLTDEIIERYENVKADTDKPFFNFSVSVGNHKPCLSYIAGVPYVYEHKVEISTKDGSKLDEIAERDVTRYYTGVYDANQAFLELTEYFSKVSEPTVLLLFGDHAPPFSDETYQQIAKHELGDDELYSTPVVTWNNYGLDKWTVTDMNANYLSASFLEYIGFPLPKACVYNKNMMKYYYQTNTKKNVISADGKRVEVDRLSDEQRKIEKATMSLYQRELDMDKDLLDLWDVPN